MVKITFETTKDVQDEIERILVARAHEFFDKAELTADAIEWQQRMDMAVELLATAKQVKQGGKE